MAIGEGLGDAPRMGEQNPRVTVKTPIIVEDLLSWRMVAYPFRLFAGSFLRP
jgi:hypothetical protein